MNRDIVQTRSFCSELKTRAEPEQDDLYIEGYFAVCNSETELWPGAYEEIATGAFDKTLDKDIRALINHETTLVLGRNKAETLELRADEKGLYGKVKINRNDTDAMNLYERVKRGDVDQCSFGFYIEKEETQYREDGSVKWTMTELDVFEVSVCTFPAYEETGVSARSKELEDFHNRKLEVRKKQLKERLKNGVETNHDNEEDQGKK